MSAADSGFYQVDAWGDYVGTGVSGARHCTLQGIVKVNDAADDYVVANEFICGRLGLAIGLPVPPGVIVKNDDGQAAYVSLRFGVHSELPPPLIPDDLVADHPHVAAGIIVFDSWLLNDDRHTGNLAYSRQGLPVNVFDHSHALLGPTAGAGAKRIESVRGDGFFRGCLIAVVNDAERFAPWVARLERLDDDFCHDVVDQARGCGALPLEDDVKAVKSALNFRRRKLGEFLTDAINRGTFPRMKGGS